MCTVPNMFVVSNSLITCIPGVFLKYILNAFGILPVVHVFAGITFVLTFPRALYFCCKVIVLRVFSAFFTSYHPVKKDEEDRTSSMRGRYETHMANLILNPREETTSDLDTDTSYCQHNLRAIGCTFAD